MSVKLLYESEEGSTYALRDRIQEHKVPCNLVCMEGKMERPTGWGRGKPICGGRGSIGV